MRLVQASLLACGLMAAACGSQDSAKETVFAESVMTEEQKAEVPQYLLVKIDQSTGAVYTAVTNQAPDQVDPSKPENIEALMKKEAEIFANAEAVTVLESDADVAEASSESGRRGRFFFGGGCGGFGFGGCGGFGFGGCGVGCGGCGFGCAAPLPAPVPVPVPVPVNPCVGIGPCGPAFGLGAATFGYGFIGGGLIDNCLYGRFALNYMFNGAGFPFGSYSVGFGQGYAAGVGTGVFAGANGTMLNLQGTPLYPGAAPGPGYPAGAGQAPVPQYPTNGQYNPYQQQQQGQYNPYQQQQQQQQYQQYQQPTKTGTGFDQLPK